ncbi:MAG: S-adenosylmethionine decarboxylase [Legionellales bacterium]|nr:S-adenosylmethionine decarboxylase [Legionellales bacterium]
MHDVVCEKVSESKIHVAPPWGVSSCVDLYDCDPVKIRSPEWVERYVNELVTLIQMKKFGPCHIVDFGEDERVAGLSMVQLIETSCITGHFANQTNTAYIDIFSCKAYDAEIAATFSQHFFRAKTLELKVNQRR